MTQPRPSDVPTWAEAPIGGDAGAVAPLSAKIARGFYANEAPPAGWWNWLLQLYGRWLRYLDARTVAQGVLGIQLTALPSTTNFGKVAFLGAARSLEVMALGSTINRSQDGGFTWAATTPAGGAPAGHFNDIAANDTVFVMVGTAGKIQRYASGAWSVQSAAAGFAGVWKKVIWTGTKFVAMGDLEIQTSPDGVTWTRVQNTAPISGGYTVSQWWDIASANGRVVLVGNGSASMVGPYSGEIYYSDDHCVTLQHALSFNTTYYHSVRAGVTIDGSPMYAAGGDDNMVASVDGASWTEIPNTPEYGPIGFFGGLMYAGGSQAGTHHLLVSANAVDWYEVPRYGHILDEGDNGGVLVASPRGYAIARRDVGSGNHDLAITPVARLF